MFSFCDIIEQKGGNGYEEIYSRYCNRCDFIMHGSLAVNYTATENTFPIQLNGENVNVEGYNIDGSTYFKLRDISDTVGGFNVDFNDSTIQLSKDGYVYETKPSTKAFVLDDNAKSFLAEQGYVIPYFTQNDLQSEDFVRSFIFYYYTEGYGADTSDQYKNGYFEWSEIP